MNSTGRHYEKSGYLVILLLAVGLTAFSHSMKELTEIHQVGLDAGRMLAQWSGNVTPAEIPQTPVNIVKIEKVEKLESCESKQVVPPVEIPEPQTEPSAVAPGRSRPTKTERAERIARPLIVKLSDAEIAKLKKLNRLEIESTNSR